jgi:nucleoside permease NupC
MGTLALILASLIDPIRFAITLAVTLFSRQKWIIPVSAIVSAIASETLLTSIQMSRTWGEGILPGVIASGIQALLCFWAVAKFRRSRKKSESGSPNGV